MQAFNRMIETMLFQIIDNLFFIYMIMILIRIFGSWVPEFSQTKFMLFVAHYTDPYLNLFRKIIPPLGMIDISPIFAIFCLNLLQGFVKYALYTMIV
jgi:YggT family protein